MMLNKDYQRVDWQCKNGRWMKGWGCLHCGEIFNDDENGFIKYHSQYNSCRPNPKFKGMNIKQIWTKQLNDVIKSLENLVAPKPKEEKKMIKQFITKLIKRWLWVPVLIIIGFLWWSDVNKYTTTIDKMEIEAIYLEVKIIRLEARINCTDTTCTHKKDGDIYRMSGRR